jgi:tetratricopeptide (TPR) repeat protein
MLKRNPPSVETAPQTCRPVSIQEEISFLRGELAMADAMSETPSRERFDALHQLRVAARLCPSAAYNLGNFLSEHSRKPRRKKRRAMALEQFANVVEICNPRIRDHDAAHEAWPDDEYVIRDLTSRALTNIGGHVANAGRPEDAVSYFQRSVRLFPENANAHVCLGNMGVRFSERTKLDPLEGIAEWKIGGQLGDFCHESANGCSCRAHVVGLVEQGVKSFGKDAMREWLESRFTQVMDMEKRHLGSFLPLIASAKGAADVTGRPWPTDVVLASEIVGAYLNAEMRLLPLEMKVTIAGSLLQTLALSRRASEAQRWRMVEEAIEYCSGVEMLKPFLGDEEWRVIGPPDSLYLDTEEAQMKVFVLIRNIQKDIPVQIKPDAIIKGLMLHLDVGFRGGVSSMIKNNLWRDHGGVAYVPAVYVGSPTGRN